MFMNNLETQIWKILNSPKTQRLIDEIYKQNNICPKKENVFNAFKFCNLNDLKIVIFGQDPYYQKNVADGLAFSTKENKTPASLVNIFKELKNEFPNFICNSNNLQLWAQQGILLLNTSLTVEQDKPLSHKEKWDFLIYDIIDLINQNNKNVIFLLWGNQAKKWKKFIDINKHYVLETSHPSPLSANKGFLGSNIFQKSNNLLKKLDKKPIDWNIYK